MSNFEENAQLKLLLSYDPLPERREEYFQYVLGEFVPTLEQMGLKLCDAWHTAYGRYPLRLNGFLVSDDVDLDEVLSSHTFLDLEARLQTYVMNYQRKTVILRRRFQFLT